MTEAEEKDEARLGAVHPASSSTEQQRLSGSAGGTSAAWWLPNDGPTPPSLLASGLGQPPRTGREARIGQQSRKIRLRSDTWTQHNFVRYRGVGGGR